jgi:3-phosphoshikimate 1-carboxyvinyltransferase
MERVAEPLRALGGAIATTDGTPPIRIGPARLRGVEWTLAVASAQVKSAILLAGLRAEGETVVREPHPTRDHTERMLGAMGVAVERRGSAVAVRGGQALRAVTVSLPGDPSSAAFFAVAAALVGGSDVVLPDLCVNPTRDGFVRVLERMGVSIERRAERVVCGEPRADLRVRGGGLGGVTIGADEVPGTIDELPILAVAAAFADGETRIGGAGELRVKESDRLDAMGQLAALGIDVTVLPDGLLIRGSSRTVPRAARISARSDHRIAMAFAIAALRVPGGIEIEDAGAVDVSFPGFFEHLAALGARVEMQT